MFKFGKNPTPYILFLVATFTFTQIAKAETGIAKPPVRPPVVVPPKPPVPVPPKPAPVPRPTPSKPGVPAPKPGSTPGAITPDPRPAVRLGESHLGGTSPKGRELAPTKLTREQVLSRLESKALKEQVKDSPEALEGLAVREGLLESALNGQKELSHLSSGKLEKALMEKLIGKDLSKMKEQDLNDLQSLLCAPMCGGHEKMALSCRRITRLMEALKSTPGILTSSGALGVLFAAFVDAKTEKVKDGSEGIVVANDAGKILEVTQLDKPVTQEKLVPEPEKSKS